MPSRSLLHWRTDRVPRLAAVEGQCAAPGQPPGLADANLRAVVLLLSAHFQGFCRDLHTECIAALVATVPPAAQSIVQTQCLAGRGLDGANPRYEIIRDDFRRFDFDIAPALGADPANTLRITHLGHLNSWRNFVAHDKPTPPAVGGPFSLATVTGWRASYDGLAVAFDGLLYAHLRKIFGADPW